MQRKGPVFQPPLEADALFLDVTTGCSYNACSFCGTYKDSVFKVREFTQVDAEIGKAESRYRDEVRRIFLGQGDALVADAPFLRKILKRLSEAFPKIQHTSIYATPRAVLEKTDRELASLRKLGLTTLYMGIESGSNQILTLLNKGITADEIREACVKARAADFKLVTLVVLGAGGRLHWREHATATAELLSFCDPHSLIMLTLMLVPHTPLFEAARRGEFTPPTPVECVLELKGLIEGLDVTGADFRSKHKSNYLKVSGRLPDDKEAMLHQLERVLNNPTEEFFKPEYFRGS